MIGIFHASENITDTLRQRKRKSGSISKSKIGNEKHMTKENEKEKRNEKRETVENPHC